MKFQQFRWQNRGKWSDSPTHMIQGEMDRLQLKLQLSYTYNIQNFRLKYVVISSLHLYIYFMAFNDDVWFQ